MRPQCFFAPICAFSMWLITSSPLLASPEADLNNLAVKQINANQYSQAIKSLETSLKLAPDYKLARENLGIAYNNLALETVSRNPQEAMKLLTRAYYFSPSTSTGDNLQKIVEMIEGKLPTAHSFLKLADDALLNKDQIGAYVDLDLAGKLDKSVADKERMQEISIRITNQIKGGFLTEVDQPSADKIMTSTADVDNSEYSPAIRAYVVTLQKLIKKAWETKGASSPSDIEKEIVCDFEIMPDGVVRNSKIRVSSGSPEVDKAALKALVKASPFPHPPLEQKEPLLLQFHFANSADEIENARPIETSVQTIEKKDNHAPSLRIAFNNQSYIHRWSENGQNEFTPEDQPTLDKWKDMLAILVFKNIGEKQELKEAFDNTRILYGSTGVVLDSFCKDVGQNGQPQYMTVCDLEDSEHKCSEIVFAKYVLHEGCGQGAVYSHRIYHEQSSVQEKNEWISKNKLGIIEKLAKWNGWPALSQLDALPSGDDPSLKESSAN